MSSSCPLALHFPSSSFLQQSSFYLCESMCLSFSLLLSKMVSGISATSVWNENTLHVGIFSGVSRVHKVNLKTKVLSVLPVKYSCVPRPVQICQFRALVGWMICQASTGGILQQSVDHCDLLFSFVLLEKCQFFSVLSQVWLFRRYTMMGGCSVPGGWVGSRIPSTLLQTLFGFIDDFFDEKS